MNALQPLDLVIEGGTVVTPDGEFLGDVGIRGETIAELGQGLGSRGRARVSAAGRIVLPGVIDAHVHCRTWTDHADEIEDSHRSAAYGGVTTALTQIRPSVELDPAEAIRYFIERGEKGSVIDFGLHTILRPEHDLATAIPGVVELGSPSVKFFMSYKDSGVMLQDSTLLRGFELARDAGAIAMVHAEDGELIAKLISDSQSRGRTALQDFLPAEPSSSEDLGTLKAVTYAAAVDCPLYVLHMTTAGSVQAVRVAQEAGQRVWGESCPKYLVLTNEALLERGPLAKVGPPLRTVQDNEALWKGVVEGVISVVASDHAPKDRDNLTETPNIFSEPYGAPGAETLLPVMFDEMIVKRGRPLTELAAVTSTNPAKIYGLYPRKGAIQVGAEADMVILDPDHPTVIRAADQHTTASYSLYEGRTVRGWPTHTFLRGKPVLSGGRLVQEPGYGQYIPRRPEDLMQLRPGASAS